MSKKIPRSDKDDYSLDIIRERQDFIEAHTPAKLDHTRQFSFDPGVMSGNIENMFGVAQVPIGLAGPLLVNGEHARGEFYVPMATVEGTMLASYNRGMRVISVSGLTRTSPASKRWPNPPLQSANCTKLNTIMPTIWFSRASTTVQAMLPDRT